MAGNQARPSSHLHRGEQPKPQQQLCNRPVKEERNAHLTTVAGVNGRGAMRAWFAAATALQPPHPTPSLSIRFVAQAQRLSEKKAVPRNCDDAKPLVCASHQASEVPDSLPLKCCWLHVPPPASRHCDCSIALQERPLHHSTHALTGRELNFLLVTSPVATSRQAHAARGPGGAPGCASRACGAIMCGLVRFGLAGGLERKGGPLGHVTPGSSRGRERSRRKKALLAVL